MVIGKSGARSVQYDRALLFLGGVAYFIWWVLIELLFPQSFNPLGSRLFVIFSLWALLAASYFSSHVRRYIQLWGTAGLWLVTLHYFYLFRYNESDVNWVVGCYITVMAVSASIPTSRALLVYSWFVLLLSVGLSISDPGLLRTVFLPGMITILIFGYFGLRSRLETSQWFLNLFDAVFEGIVLHQNGRVVDSNGAFAEIFGYEKKEVHGMKIIQFVSPELRDFVSEKILTASEEPYEVIGIRKDGSRVPIEIRGKKHLVRGKLYRLSAVVDLTARKKSERDRVLYEASLESIRIRDEFLSVVSHELKTPVTTIKLQTQLARVKVTRGDSDSSGVDSFLALIDQTDRQADRLTRLIEGMLDVSQIATGQMKLERVTFDLSELVRETVSLLSTTLKQSGSEISIDAPSPVMLDADRFRMEQVVVNLVSNAIKYGRGQPISISTSESEKEVRLMVRDRGIGIGREDHERIFKRFERAISAKKISGLGLGLFICKYIVDLHEGKIEIESELGKGSTFTVVLPRALQT